MDKAVAEVEKRVLVGVLGADPLMLLGLEAILEERAGIGVRPVALTERKKLAQLATLLLDSAAVADVQGVLGELRHLWPLLPVIVLGDTTDAGHVQAVIAAGAKGYLMRTATEAEMRMALDVVLDGSVWAPRKVLAKLIDAGGVMPVSGPEAPRMLHSLTRREREVLKLLLDGHTNRGIAESLGVDQVTVKAHLGRMFRKAGVKNRVELMGAAHSQSMGSASQSGTAGAVPG